MVCWVACDDSDAINTTTTSGSSWVLATTTAATSSMSRCYWASGAAATSDGYWVGDCNWVVEDTSMGFSQADTVATAQQTLALMMAQQTAFMRTGRSYIRRVEQPPSPTPEQIAAQRAVALKASEATERAKELLLEHLTPGQRETFVNNGWFVVEGGRSKTRYRIHTNSYAGNIDVLADDKIEAKLCCHCVASIPRHDHHLAQKLMLENAEDEFLRLANRRAA